MGIDQLMGNQSIIISLDVDNSLFDKLKQISKAGLSLVEINSSDKDLLQTLIEENPRLKIGAGNVISTQQLEDAYGAGVHFATSPGFLAEIAQTASIYSMNYLPGVATLSEAMSVIALGHRQVRPFPASLGFCTLLNNCLPQLKLYPAEVEWEQIDHFFNLPAVAALSIHNPEPLQLESLGSLATQTSF